MVKLEENKDLGLLIIRIGIGVMFIYHGLPKLMGGPQVWHGLGKAMAFLGITFLPVCFGFMAACAEFAGGILLIAGIKARLAAFFMFFTMFVASLMHIRSGHGLAGASHAIELMIVFGGLLFTGPGAYRLKP